MPRPAPTFHDFIGHRKVVDLLRRQLAGAQARGRPFPPTLFTGASGLGKSLVAAALAAEYGTTMVSVTGDISRTDLVDRLITLNTNDFVFIDEAHALESPVQEVLYEPIDHFRVLRIPGSVAASAPREGDEATIAIRPCTIVLATDQPGLLNNALDKRMALCVALNYYPIDELKEIVDRMATDMDLLLSAQAAKLIAKASAGIPRRAKYHLRNLQNHFPNSENDHISVPQVKEFLATFDIDERGLGPQERQYCAYLKEVGSASLESLAIHLGVDPDFVRRQIEPLPMREGLVSIGSRGRKLTPAGANWINCRNGANP